MARVLSTFNPKSACMSFRPLRPASHSHCSGTTVYHFFNPQKASISTVWALSKTTPTFTSNRVLPQHQSFRRLSASSDPSTFTKSSYIQPLSQIVLERLQSKHGGWLQKMGLDEGLVVNKDGTFVLRFPIDPSSDGEVKKEGSDSISTLHEDASLSQTGSIWTMFEPEEKKHYLCITRGNLIGRYLLQDNKKPAWHSDKRSTPERVQDAVDEMVQKMEGFERERK